MIHSPGFLSVVDAARPQVNEITLEEARQRLERNPTAVLLDVREDREWDKAHAARGLHLGRGVLERDIEERFPNKDTELLMYCGGGYRSVLACQTAQQMGYRNVFSILGGYREMLAQGWPMTSGQA